MKLDDLLARAGAVVDMGWTAKTVEWTDDGGESVSFSVIVKNEMTAGDHEFIFLGIGDPRMAPKGKANERQAPANDVSIMARRVHRMVRFGDDKEPIPLTVAERMKPSLLGALLRAVDDSEIEPETLEEAAKN